VAPVFVASRQPRCARAATRCGLLHPASIRSSGRKPGSTCFRRFAATSLRSGRYAVWAAPSRVNSRSSGRKPGSTCFRRFAATSLRSGRYVYPSLRGNLAALGPLRGAGCSIPRQFDRPGLSPVAPVGTRQDAECRTLVAARRDRR
jgi:hypothetical protein